MAANRPPSTSQNVDDRHGASAQHAACEATRNLPAEPRRRRAYRSAPILTSASGDRIPDREQRSRLRSGTECPATRVADKRVLSSRWRASLNAGTSRRSDPFGFMALRDVPVLSNFVERTVSTYQVGITGDVNFDEEF